MPTNITVLDIYLKNEKFGFNIKFYRVDNYMIIHAKGVGTGGRGGAPALGQEG